jgi:hypothetical protein
MILTMSISGPTKRPLKLLTKIRSDLAEVNSLCVNWEEGSNSEDEERVEALVESAFESSLVLMETIGRPDTRNRILTIFERAKKNLSETRYSVIAGELYSVWSDRLSQILNAVEKAHFQLAKDVEEPLEIIARIVERFVAVERALQHRHDSRPTLSVRDEYDIQDLLRALLSTHFDDVSAEDPGHKFGGSSTRVDLLLRKARIAVEIKKTRSDMTERTLGKELKLDIVDYKQRANCEALVIVIDDRAGRLKNPKGFADDLMRVEEGFRVEVYLL